MAGTWGRVIGGQHAFVWSNGSFTDLGTLGGLTTTANAINAAGQVVGTSSASYCCDLEYDPVCECYVTVLTPNCIGANPLHAFGGGMTDLGPGGCDGSSFAYGNNDSGQIVGEWRASTSQGAAVWAGGGPTIIGPGVAYDINNAGQVVGETGVFGTPTRAGLWDSGGWTQLYGGTSAARAINDVGQVVGSAYYDPYPPSSPYEGTYITVWEGGMMRVYDHGTAYDINNSGEFVGSHLFDGTFYAKTSWLGWTVGDINGMVKSQFRWAHIITATGINDSGDIVGTGVRQQGGPARAFLMTKCDSPHAASPDCDGNGVFDGCDILNGTSRDCDFSGVPDECETLADCNANGAPDACDILDGASRDCDNSGVPDECESLPDCNNNGMPDACDIADETSQDCDLNGVPDECDPDFDGDGIPDACEVVITDVSSQFVSPSKAKVFFLDGVSLSETFTATVNWQGNTPSAVRFITPQGTFSGSGSGTTWTYALDMGSDFGQGGLLTVQAESTDGATSPPYVVNLKVVAPPIGMVPAFLSAQPSGGTLKYVTPSVSGGQDLVVEAGVGPGTITSTIPLFGSEEFAFGSVFKLSAEVSGDGSASGMFLNLEFPSNQHKTKMAGFKFRPKVTGTATWQFDDAANQWAPGGRVTFGGTVGADVPPVPVQFLVLGIPAYWRGHIDVGLTAGLDLMSWTAPGQPVWNGTLSLDPFPKAEAELGVGVADVMNLHGYLGGRAWLDLQYPQTPTLQELGIALTGGVRFVTWFVTYEWPLLTCNWDSTSGGDCNWGSGGAGALASSAPLIRILPRKYLIDASSYAQFVANSPPRGGSVSSTVETAIQLNVFDQSTPDLAANGDNLLLVWAQDNPVRTPVNRTEVVFAKYDAAGQTWSTPVAVADDATADFHPQIAALANGDAWLAWENVSAALAEPGDPNDPIQVEAKLEEMKGKTEIAVAKYDAVVGTWGAQTVLTSNTHLDRSPRIASAADGTAMLTWVSNAGNEPIGSVTNANDIRFATFDGAAWSAPADAAVGVSSIVKSAMAYNGTNAVLLFIGDTDGDLQTADDRELFATTYDGVTWSAVTQLTNDLIEDANPQVAYDSTGNLLLAWYLGGDIVAATDLSLSDQSIAVARQGGASSGAADFRLATGPAGQIALIWQDASIDQVDLWSAVNDPTLQVWSLPQRLTADGSMEYALAPVFDASGDLVAAYDKVQILYESRTVPVNGTPVQIDNVPVPDQTDLYVLRHTIGGDLAVATADVTLDPANPIAGDTVAITAIVENLGNAPATNIETAFYDGDPTAGGTLIDTVQTIVGPLVGGDETSASVSWLVPASPSPHDIYVVVDPNMLLSDRDRVNNTAVLVGVMRPDLAIDSILAEAPNSTDRNFTVRLVNLSGVDVSNIDVTLRQDALTGPVLTTLSVPGPIAAGGYVDTAWLWLNAAPFGGSVVVFANADDAGLIDEYDEANNSRSVILRDEATVSDCNVNGYDDTEDIAGGLSQDCNGNGVPDECDVAGGSSQDCNGNSVPDECDVLVGTSLDCNADGQPDECEVRPAGLSSIPFEFDATPSIAWNFRDNSDDFGTTAIPLGFSVQLGGESFTHFGQDSNGYVELLRAGELPYNYSYGSVAGLTNSGTPNHTFLMAGYDDLDPSSGDWFGYRLETDRVTFYWLNVPTWDDGDIAYANTYQMILYADGRIQWNFLSSSVFGWSYDLFSGVYLGHSSQHLFELYREFLPDQKSWVFSETTADCNGNAIPDDCDIAGGTCQDINSNGVPDKCEADCNTNGVQDYLDLVLTTSRDCNTNGVPDECDISAGMSQDCNGNGFPDSCDVRYYSVIDLGTLGGTWSDALSINDVGQIVGYGDIPTGGYHGFLWQTGAMTDLGTLPGDTRSKPYDINDSGDVVGMAYVSLSTWHAFLWQSGVMTDLGTLGGQRSGAYGINNAGQIAGQADTVGPGHAFLWDNGVMTDLGTLGGTYSWANDLNESGDVVGASNVTTDSHAFVYSGGVMTDLGIIPGGRDSGATALNDSGRIAGYAWTTQSYPGDPQAVFWDGGVMTMLGTLGGVDGRANGINNTGEIVGRAQTATGTDHAFLWQSGVMKDLNDLIPPDTGWVLEEANDINGRGQIVGAGYHAGQFRAFLMTPPLQPGGGDCNASGVPDECDIAAGTAVDCNLTNVPDECETLVGGDFDADGNVTLADLSALVDCLAAPGMPPNPPAPQCTATCLDVFDDDGDGNIDLKDFAAFQRNFTG